MQIKLSRAEIEQIIIEHLEGRGFTAMPITKGREEKVAIQLDGRTYTGVKAIVQVENDWEHIDQ